MAARKLRPFHTDEIRAKIQTSQLINRLTDHAFGKVALEASQVRSIEVLLRKSIPDLSAVTLTGAEGGAVQIEAVGWNVRDT